MINKKKNGLKDGQIHKWKNGKHIYIYIYKYSKKICNPIIFYQLLLYIAA